MGQLTGTRREVLRRGSAAIGAAAIIGNAGCLGVLGSGGDYADWLPEPGTIRDGNHYSFGKTDYAALAESEDEIETEFSDIELGDATSFDWEDVTMHLRFEGILVIESDFEKDSVVDDFEDADFAEEEADYEGFTILLDTEATRAVGVGDDVVVAAGYSFGAISDPGGAVEAVIDTSNGDEDRYTADEEDFDVLVDELDDGHSLYGSTRDAVEEGRPEQGRFEGMVATGQTLTVDGEETDGKWVTVYEEADQVDVDDVEEYVETSQDNGGQFADWDDVEVEKDDRVATITAVIDTDDL